MQRESTAPRLVPTRVVSTCGLTPPIPTGAPRKGDLPEVYEAYPELKQRFAEIGVELHMVSSAAHQGLDTLMQRLAREIFVD
jgi:hypothetical protein